VSPTPRTWSSLRSTALSRKKNVAGVILRINSPGGSPVQAGIVNDEIHRLRAKHPEKPLYAVVEDMCASGGYYVAVAADKIYVNKASIVGSIGVLMDGFGFTGTMDKAGCRSPLADGGRTTRVSSIPSRRRIRTRRRTLNCMLTTSISSSSMWSRPDAARASRKRPRCSPD
jgi:membrane-bound ClpP family serine protease